jgi:hypothetical protein
VAASVNGWRVLTRSECHNVEVPGGVLPIHPELAWLAWDCAWLWHETVEPLDTQPQKDDWGWAAPRPIRGGTVTTNHSSGTAWDLNATLHPRGVPIARTFRPEQLEAVANMEARYFGVLRWGGRWTGKDVDGMHWEVAPGVTVEAVRDLTASLQAQEDAPAPTPAPPAPTPAPPPPPAPSGPGWTGPDLTGTGLGLRGDHGNNGRRVEALQGWLRRTFPAYRHDLGGQLIGVDGWWGDQTTAWVRSFALRSNIRTADGRNIGPQIARRLYLSGFRG